MSIAMYSFNSWPIDGVQNDGKIPASLKFCPSLKHKMFVMLAEVGFSKVESHIAIIIGKYCIKIVNGLYLCM